MGSESEDRKTTASGSCALQLTTSYGLPVTKKQIIEQDIKKLKACFIILKELL